MTPPSRLTEQQKKKWDEILSENVIHDFLSLESYVIEFCRWQSAEKWLRENGEVITLRNDKGVVKGLVQAPQLKIARDSSKLCRELAEILDI